MKRTRAPRRATMAARALSLIPLLVVPGGAVAQAPDSTVRDTAARRLPPIAVVGSVLPVVAPGVGSGIPGRTVFLTSPEVRRWRPRHLADALVGQPGMSLYDDLGSPLKQTQLARGFS